MGEKLLTATELAEILQVHETTIYRWADKGMPRIKKGTKFTRYQLSKVLEWIEERNDKNE